MYVARVTMAYLWKIHIGAVCSRPPFLDLDHSRQSFWRGSLISNPIHSRKGVEVVSIPPRLHSTDSEILNIDILRPWCNCIVNCHGVVQVHVIQSNLYMNLFIRIKLVWWECHCLAAWIRTLGNTKKFFTTMRDGKTFKFIKNRD